MKKFLKTICLFSMIMMIFCSFGCSKDQSGSDNLFDFTFKINDTTYTLPEKIETFTNAGWEFPSDFKNFDKTIKYGNVETTYLSEGDNWFNIEIFNNKNQDLKLSDCEIGRITYDFSGDIDFYTAGNFKLNGKKLNDIISKYGDPFSTKDYSTYTEVIYDKDPTSGIYDRYVFRFELDTKILKQVDITYFY